MSKGERTKERILERAAGVFNRQGYFGASLADIMEATGLEKGGIYNHFASKDDLALQAYDYAVGLVNDLFSEALKGKRNAIDRLRAIAGVYRGMPQGVPVAGGCPVLNTAIEADDAHPILRQKAQATMDEWQAVVRRVVARGIERGEVRADVDPDEVATLLIATLEGAIMMSKLYGDAAHMDRAVDHLEWYFETSLRMDSG